MAFKPDWTGQASPVRSHLTATPFSFNIPPFELLTCFPLGPLIQVSSVQVLVFL